MLQPGRGRMHSLPNNCFSCWEFLLVWTPGSSFLVTYYLFATDQTSIMANAFGLWHSPAWYLWQAQRQGTVHLWPESFIQSYTTSEHGSSVVMITSHCVYAFLTLLSIICTDAFQCTYSQITLILAMFVCLVFYLWFSSKLFDGKSSPGCQEGLYFPVFFLNAFPN